MIVHWWLQYKCFILENKRSRFQETDTSLLGFNKVYLFHAQFVEEAAKFVLSQAFWMAISPAFLVAVWPHDSIQSMESEQKLDVLSPGWDPEISETQPSFRLCWTQPGSSFHFQVAGMEMTPTVTLET